MAVQIEIFDTTLRDGEQSPGASMDEREKVQMAQQLDRLGVDIIEAGFPIASNQEYEAVRKVGQAVERARVAALARALPKDIERAAGERVGFTLLVFTEGRASYISTVQRDFSVQEIKRLLGIWEQGMPDVPAHEYRG